MSWAHIEWSYRQETLSSSQKSVLVCLAYHANETTSNAYPCINLICKETELDRKTVIAALRELVENGWIEDTRKFTGRTKQIKVYHFQHVVTVPKTERLDRQRVEKGYQKSPATGGERVPPPVPFSGHGILNPESGTLNNEGGSTPPPVEEDFEGEFKKWENSLHGQFPSALRQMRKDFREQRRQVNVLGDDTGRGVLNRKIGVLNRLIEGPQPKRVVSERTKVLMMTGRTDEKEKEAVQASNVDWVSAMRKAVNGE